MSDDARTLLNALNAGREVSSALFDWSPFRWGGAMRELEMLNLLPRSQDLGHEPRQP
jgi:hypothetical protein